MTLPARRRLVFLISRNGYSLERSVENFTPGDRSPSHTPIRRSHHRHCHPFHDPARQTPRPAFPSSPVTTSTTAPVSRPMRCSERSGILALPRARTAASPIPPPRVYPFVEWAQAAPGARSYSKMVSRSTIPSAAGCTGDRIPRQRSTGSKCFAAERRIFTAVPALGGVIQLRRRHPQQAASMPNCREVAADIHRLFFRLDPLRGFIAEVSAERFSTDGYFLIPEDSRGPVDRPAASDHTAADLTVTRPFDSGEPLPASRFIGNLARTGPRLQLNDSTVRQYTAAATRAAGPARSLFAVVR